MKKLISVLSFALCAVFASAQTIAINFDLGVLKNAGGTALSNGSLVQVIASQDTTFDAPSPTSFATGNDILLFSTALNSATLDGIAGGTSFAMNISLSQFPVVGYNLVVRWFPTLTTSSSAPGGSTFYGQYGYAQDNTWVVPAAGSTIGLQMITTAIGGSVSDATARATLQTAPVPEPSTYAAIFGALALGFVAYRRRQVRA